MQENIEYTYFTTGEKINIKIDYENSTINGKRVEEEAKGIYTFKNMKTKIKATEGIEGLVGFIKSCNQEGDVFNWYTFNFLQKISKDFIFERIWNASKDDVIQFMELIDFEFSDDEKYINTLGRLEEHLKENQNDFLKATLIFP